MEQEIGRHQGLFMSVYLSSSEGRRRRSTAADFIYFWTLLLDLIWQVHEIYVLKSLPNSRVLQMDSAANCNCLKTRLMHSSVWILLKQILCNSYVFIFLQFASQLFIFVLIVNLSCRCFVPADFIFALVSDVYCSTCWRRTQDKRDTWMRSTVFFIDFFIMWVDKMLWNVLLWLIRT